MFLAGRTEDDFSCVEMYVYDDEQGSLYVHHDVRLEAFPLALAFLQHGSAGARVAVGTMEPRIDVWDLDVMEPAAPVASLGGDAPTAAGRKAPRPTPGAHGDAVLSVSWRRHADGLASGSADRTVKLWDLNARACARGVDAPRRPRVERAAPAPTRASSAGASTHAETRRRSRGTRPSPPASPRAATTAASRCATRDARRRARRSPREAASSRSRGTRSSRRRSWRRRDRRRRRVRRPRGRRAALVASGARGGPRPPSGFSETAAGLLATASADASVKLWDCGGAPGPPAPVAARDLAVGELFALAFDAADPLVLVAAGAGGSVALWDAAGDDGAAAAWLAAQG